VIFPGSTPEIDILASDQNRTRTVAIQVKTKTAGAWQTSIKRGRRRKVDPDESGFWVFVDIGKDPDARPDFFIAPRWWIENSIYKRHRAYLARHGGQRARTPASKHHAIPPNVVEEWRERWDVLNIF
jgi:hypothetical protein